MILRQLQNVNYKKCKQGELLLINIELYYCWCKYFTYVCGYMADDIVEPYNDKGDISVNPFMFQSELRALKFYSNHKLYSPDEFRESGHEIVPKEKDSLNSFGYTHNYLIDLDSSCKVFQNDMVRELVVQLDGSALRLMLFIVYKITRNTDRIRINYHRYTKYASISTKTYYTALNKLIERGVLGKHKPNVYWVNPLVIFNGDRLKKYPAKVVVKIVKGDKK